MTSFLTIMQIVPALIAALKAIEEAIPGQGKGEQKLAAVREITETVYAEGSVLWPSISKVISILVGLFNKTGAFSTSTPVK